MKNFLGIFILFGLCVMCVNGVCNARYNKFGIWNNAACIGDPVITCPASCCNTNILGGQSFSGTQYPQMGVVIHPNVNCGGQFLFSTCLKPPHCYQFPFNGTFGSLGVF